jgi:hypothetical protein
VPLSATAYPFVTLAKGYAKGYGYPCRPPSSRSRCRPSRSLTPAERTPLLESDEELANVSKLLGHADLGTTADLYGHLTPKIARRASERIVCFTSESGLQFQGEQITRAMQELLAVQHGLTVHPRVTKKVDILVIGLGHPRTGKVKSAEEYGTLILEESVFWSKLGVNLDA